MTDTQSCELDRARELMTWFRAHLERLHGLARTHPHSEDIATQTRQWVAEFHIADGKTGGYQLDQSMLVPCYVMPSAPTDVVGTLARYYTWLAAVNDELIYTDSSIDIFIETVKKILHDGAPLDDDADRLILAMASIRDSILQLDASLILKFTDGVMGTLRAWRRRQQWVRSGDLPSLAEYLDYRAFCLAIDEASLLQRLQPDLLEPHKPYTYGLARISKSAGLLTSLVNDLISYPMEIRRGEEFTLFRVLAQEYGISHEQTFPSALALVSAVHHELNALVSALRADANVNATERHQADALVAWVDGTYRWHLAGTRYDYASTSDVGTLQYPQARRDVQPSDH
ncbi:hypothetical protein AB0D14_41465 [Streptomyces sp. NPDC048484]|uniref:terpene synthase family protein n=1 Tax=Streptomyces sp. NPDC048484 TaxID=3155146 RepID=UPI0034366685